MVFNGHNSSPSSKIAIPARMGRRRCAKIAVALYGTIFLGAAFFALLARLWYLQVVEGEQFMALATAQSHCARAV
jgi:cell division protein FtsI/penicillin-binding protein 2